MSKFAVHVPIPVLCVEIEHSSVQLTCNQIIKCDLWCNNHGCYQTKFKALPLKVEGRKPSYPMKWWAAKQTCTVCWLRRRTLPRNWRVPIDMQSQSPCKQWSYPLWVQNANWKDTFFGKQFSVFNVSVSSDCVLTSHIYYLLLNTLSLEENKNATWIVRPTRMHTIILTHALSSFSCLTLT